MRKTYFFIILLTGLIAVALPAQASLTFDYNTEYSGAYAPSGTPPWLSATFTETAADTVQLTLTAVNLSSSEFVSKWLFNLDPIFESLIPPSSVPGAFTITTTSGVAPDSISILANGENAGGGFKFDILFEFDTSGSNPFGEGASSTFDIVFNRPTGNTDTFNAMSFDFQTAGKGTSDGLYTAAHVQGIDNAYSGWVTTSQVPIPGAVWLLGSGLFGLLGFRKRFKK